MPIVSHPWRVIEGVLALGDEPHRLAVAAAWATSVSLADLPELATSSVSREPSADLAFDRLVAAGVLETAGDRFQFAVPLVQAALRGELGPAARRAALEPIHDSPSLIELIIAEGDTSSASQPQSAIEMYRRALDLQDRASVDDPTLRLKLAHALTFADASPGGSRPGDRPARVTRAKRSSRGLRTGGGGTPIGQPPRRGGVDSRRRPG